MIDPLKIFLTPRLISMQNSVVSDINSNLKIYFCEVPKVWGTLGPVPLEWGMADPLEIQYFPTLLFLKKLLAYFYGHGVVPVINFFVCIRQLYSS